MKTKIKEAITQGYKNLGVPETVVDGLAALGVTVVKDESEIAAFVEGEAVKGVMKSYQSEADKVRTEYSTKLKGLEKEKAELEAKLNGNNQSQGQQGQQQQQQSQQSQQHGGDNQQNETVPAWAQEILDSNKVLRDELAGFKAAKAKEDAVTALDKFINEWDYAEGFPKERDMAKHIAMKVYKAGGEQMNGEQLIAAFREEFDPAVKDKGVTDFSKPFQSDGGGGDNHQARFEAMAKRQQERQGAVAGE